MKLNNVKNKGTYFLKRYDRWRILLYVSRSGQDNSGDSHKIHRPLKKRGGGLSRYPALRTNEKDAGAPALIRAHAMAAGWPKSRENSFIYVKGHSVMNHRTLSHIQNSTVFSVAVFMFKDMYNVVHKT